LEILNNQPMLSYTGTETVRADHTTIITLVAHAITFLWQGGLADVEEDTVAFELEGRRTRPARVP